MTYFALRPVFSWLRTRALAHPNSRSSHTVPTPQGAGIVIIPVAIMIAALPFALQVCTLTQPAAAMHACLSVAAILCLTLVGFLDDRRPLSITLRLGLQIIAAVLVVFTMPNEFRLLPSVLPLVAERIFVVVAVVWFVNLTNFMDGVDLMSATETVAITIGVTGLAAMGAVSPELGWVASALLGAMIAFIPWNAPPARIFLGDAGSLPLGLLLALMLLHIAASGHITSALILPLYYLADATFTMARRLVKGERIWEAHRDHFYQRALRGGMPVGRLISYIALTNAGLVALSILAASAQNSFVRFGLLLIAISIVACTGYSLSRAGAASRTNP
jgi:UDP-N-acetylmuramyl pentapeptide phosphotransferase/UDP-N-acetylglucosamine-1-phosphate transferase